MALPSRDNRLGAGLEIGDPLVDRVLPKPQAVSVWAGGLGQCTVAQCETV